MSSQRPNCLFLGLYLMVHTYASLHALRTPTRRSRNVSTRIEMPHRFSLRYLRRSQQDVSPRLETAPWPIKTHIVSSVAVSDGEGRGSYWRTMKVRRRRRETHMVRVVPMSGRWHEAEGNDHVRVINAEMNRLATRASATTIVCRSLNGPADHESVLGVASFFLTTTISVCHARHHTGSARDGFGDDERRSPPSR